MTSMPIRNPETDHLLTPNNCAFIFIDIEPIQVAAIIDAVGGTTRASHEAGLRRIEQAGARPISWTSLMGELQRDWARSETAGPVGKVLFTVEGK